jgi:hypothetical protein
VCARGRVRKRKMERGREKEVEKRDRKGNEKEGKIGMGESTHVSMREKTEGREREHEPVILLSISSIDTLHWKGGERIFIEVMTSGHKRKASGEGSK